MKFQNLLDELERERQKEIDEDRFEDLFFNFLAFFFFVGLAIGTFGICCL